MIGSSPEVQAPLVYPPGYGPHRRKNASLSTLQFFPLYGNHTIWTDSPLPKQSNGPTRNPFDDPNVFDRGRSTILTTIKTFSELIRLPTIACDGQASFLVKKTDDTLEVKSEDPLLVLAGGGPLGRTESAPATIDSNTVKGGREAIPLPDGPQWPEMATLHSGIIDSLMEAAKRTRRKRDVSFGAFKLELGDDTICVEARDIITHSLNDSSIEGSIMISKVNDITKFQAKSDVWLQGTMAGASTVAICRSRGMSATLVPLDALVEKSSAEEMLNQGIELIEFLDRACQPGKSYWLYKPREAPVATLMDITQTTPSDVEPWLTIGLNCLNGALQISTFLKTCAGVLKRHQLQEVQSALISRGLQAASSVASSSSKAKDLTVALQAAKVQIGLDSLAEAVGILVVETPQPVSSGRKKRKSGGKIAPPPAQDLVPIAPPQTTEALIDKVAEITRLLDEIDINLDVWKLWRLDVAIRLTEHVSTLSARLRGHDVLQLAVLRRSEHLAELVGDTLAIFLSARLLAFNRVVRTIRQVDAWNWPLTDRALAKRREELRLFALSVLTRECLGMGLFLATMRSLSSSVSASQPLEMKDHLDVRKMLHEKFRRAPLHERQRVASMLDRLHRPEDSVLDEKMIELLASRDTIWDVGVNRAVPQLLTVLHRLDLPCVRELLHSLGVIQHERALDPAVEGTSQQLAQLVCAFYLCGAAKSSHGEATTSETLCAILLSLSKAFQGSSSHRKLHIVVESQRATLFSDQQYQAYMASFKCATLASQMLPLNPKGVSTSLSSEQAAVSQSCLGKSLSIGPSVLPWQPTTVNSAEIRIALPRLAVARRAYAALALGVDVNQYLPYQSTMMRGPSVSSPKEATGTQQRKSSPTAAKATDLDPLFRTKSQIVIGGADESSDIPIQALAELLALRLKEDASAPLLNANSLLFPMLAESLRMVIGRDDSPAHQVLQPEELMIQQRELSTVALSHLRIAKELFVTLNEKKEAAVCSYYMGRVWGRPWQESPISLEKAIGHLDAATKEFNVYECTQDFCNSIGVTFQLLANAADSESEIIHALSVGMAAELLLHTAHQSDEPMRVDWNVDLRRRASKLSFKLLRIRGCGKSISRVPRRKSKFSGAVRGDSLEDVRAGCRSWLQSVGEDSLKQLCGALLRGGAIEEVLSAETHTPFGSK